MELIRARNAGEAKHLVKENRMFREHKRFMDHKNKVGKVGNNQKHVSLNKRTREEEVCGARAIADLNFVS